jgi:hypothetical protein
MWHCQHTCMASNLMPGCCCCWYRRAQETSRRRASESDMALYLPDLVQQGANMVMVQLVVQLPATLDLVFLSASGRDSSELRKAERLAQLSGGWRGAGAVQQ